MEHNLEQESVLEIVKMKVLKFSTGPVIRAAVQVIKQVIIYVIRVVEMFL